MDRKTRKMVRNIAKINLKDHLRLNKKRSLVFNQICTNEKLLPKYTLCVEGANMWLQKSTLRGVSFTS